MPPLEILRSQIDTNLAVLGRDHLVMSARVLIAGLGGSRLAGAILRDMLSDMHIEMHSGFDAPTHAAFLGSGMIASSTSGNTVETLSAYEACGRQGFARAVVTRGGELLAAAKRDGVPYVVMPESELPPRESLVHSLRAHCLLLGRSQTEREIQEAFAGVDVRWVSECAQHLTPLISGKSVLLYAADELESLLRYIKVNLNETARVPAYIGLVPEVLHGEIAVLEGGRNGPRLAEQVTIVQLCHEGTDHRITDRMRALTTVVQERGVAIETVTLPGRGWRSVAHGAVLSLALSHALREQGGISREGENLIGAFKRAMLKQNS